MILLQKFLGHRNRLCFSLWTAFATMLFVSACASGPLREDIKARNFKIGKLPSSWRLFEKEKSGDADMLYEKSRTGAFISVNSVCNRYPDSSLDSLLNELFVPIQHAEVASTRDFKLDDRAALEKIVTGTIDGVDVESRFVVIRKNNCIFDFTLNSRNKIRDEANKEFDNMLAGFHYE